MSVGSGLPSRRQVQDDDDDKPVIIQSRSAKINHTGAPAPGEESLSLALCSDGFADVFAARQRLAPGRVYSCPLSTIVHYRPLLSTVHSRGDGGTASGHKGIPGLENNLLYMLVLLLYLL